MSIKVVFLDRDGVINKEIGYLHKIKDFVFIEGVFEACKHFLSLEYEIIIITNQSGIARGLYKAKDFHVVNEWMLDRFKQEGVDILDVFFCPHAPEDNCHCRKPKPGLFLNAKDQHDIDMNNSWMVGDKETDVLAANSAGISQTVLVRSGHDINESGSRATCILDSILQSNTVIRS